MIPLGILLALAGPPNVVLVTLDSLRADYLHAYGRAGIETPATDRLAREGVVVEDATVQAPETKPSLVSILTGRHPWEHGVRDDFTPRVGDGMETLATILHGRGYKTAAFVGSYVLASDFGLNRGFDLYDEPFSDAPHGFERYRHRERPAWRIVEKALDWLNHAGPGPLFLWAHLDDLHFPYTTHAPFAEKYKDQPYAGQVAYADAQLERLLDFFDKQGLRGRTLFVLTSDHGEGLGEHGEDEHRFFLYDSTLRVPLILSQPGLLPAGTRVRGQFRSVDILPTVLALIGAPAVATSGASRAAELRSGRRLPDNESPSEALFGALHYGYAPVRALRGERWKLIDAPRPELYDLRADPQEATNLIEARPAVAAAMRDHLRAHDGDPRGTAGRLPSTADPAMAETMTVLKTIGAPTLAAGAASGADPKDKTLEIRQLRNDAIEAQQLAGSGQPGRALEILDRLSRAGVASFDDQKLRAELLLRSGRHEDAIQSLEIALRMAARYDDLYVKLAEANLDLGRNDQAREALERGLRLEPGNPVLLAAKGGLLQRLGDLQGARTVLEAALAAEPSDVRLLVQVAYVSRALGDNERAIEALHVATQLSPTSVPAFIDYGAALAAAGRKKEAIAAFRFALKHDPRASPALLGLARALLPENPEAALPLLQRLVALDPGFPGVEDALAEARAGRAAAPSSFRLVRTDDRATAEEVARALAAGSALPAAAAATPEVPLDSIDEPARAAAARLSPGQVSEVVPTPAGFVVVKRER